MSKTVALATISTQCGFTNGAPVNSNVFPPELMQEAERTIGEH